MSKTVMLEFSSQKYQVTYEGYLRIRQNIKMFQVCPTCGNRIDEAEHLLVSRECLACVLGQNSSLTFVGQDGENSDGEKIYVFTNQEGIILTSIENTGGSPQQDIAMSLEKAGFTIPTTYKPFKSTEELHLGRYAWSVYGKLTQSVVVLHYADTYNRSRVEIDFLAYKGGQTIEFNKRTTEHKNMLEKARQLAEHTKKEGYYYLNGGKFRVLEEVHLFRIVAQLESAAYEAQLAFLASLEPAQEQRELPDLEEETPAQPSPIEQETLSVVDSLPETTPETTEHISVTTSEGIVQSEEPEQPAQTEETVVAEPESIVTEPSDQAQAVEVSTPEPEVTSVPKAKGKGKLHIVKPEGDISREEAGQEGE